MAVPGSAKDLEEQIRAGNEEDASNIARKLQDQRVNNGQHDDLSSEGYNRSTDALNDREKEFGNTKSGQFTDSHGDLVDANYNGGDDNQTAAAALNEKEQAGSPPPLAQPGGAPSGRSGFWGKLLAGSKRFGPSGGLAGLIIGGFGVTSVIVAPGSLLVAIEKAVTNDGSDSTRTNIVFRKSYVSKLFAAKTGSSPSKIEDKMTSMSEDQKARWVKEGFQIDLDDKGKITRMVFPDGTEVKTPDAFNSHAENTVEGRRTTNRVLDVRSAFFENQKFKDILKRFNIEKSKRISPSDDKDPAKRKEAIDKSFDDNAGLKAEDPANPDARITDLKAETSDSSTVKQKVSEISDKAGKVGLAALPVSIACATYNVAQLTNATIKAKWVYDLVSFAYPFVRAAAQIESQGDIEPSVVENLADRLTWYDSNKTVTKSVPNQPSLNVGDPNPQYNHSALDSQGLKMAIYGDFTGLTDFTKQFTAWGWETSVDSAAKGYLDAANSALGGKQNFKKLCQGAKAANEIASLQCIAQPWLCALAAVVVPALEKAAFSSLVTLLAQPAIDFIAKVDLSSALKGEGAGDAIAVGISWLLSDASLGSALRPAGGPNALQDIKKFIADTNDVNYKYTTQVALDEAKDNPFDVTNQYSFMGQLASLINPYLTNDGTMFSKITNLTSVVNTSLTKLPDSTANALFSQPSNMTLKDGLGGDAAANRIGKCKSPSMADIQAACDWSGRIVGYTSDNVIQGLNNISNNTAGSDDILGQSISYMTSGDKKNIDPNTGDTVAGSDFENYVNYCVKRENGDKGTVPIGSSTGKIAEDDGNWFDGERCMGKDAQDQKMLDSFATYYNWCYVQYATAERKTDCVHDQSEDSASGAANSSSTCGDGSTKSIYTCALQFDKYTYQYSAGHDQYGKVSWYQGFKSNPPAPPANPFDCSSLVMASVVAAFGHDVPGMSAPGGFHDTKYWKKVGDGQGQQGDVIVWSGHVEIINAKDSTGYATFGAHTQHTNNPDADISPSHYGLHGEGQGDTFDGVYQYVGPGLNTGATSV